MNKVRMILALACAGALSASAAKPLNFVWIVAADLANDQNEASNLTSRFPERAAVLKERWLKVSTSLGPAGWGAFKDRVARD